MKKIIVIDWLGEMINSIYDTDQYEISLAIVDNVETAKKLNNKFSNVKVFYPREVNSDKEYYDLNKNSYNLSNEDIYKYRNTQYKVNNFLFRVFYDKITIDERYYIALSYFLDFFANNDIDFIISSEIEHGDVVDTIIMDIAKNINIPVYNITSISSCFNKEICALFRQNDKKFIPILKLNSEKTNISSFIREVNQSFFKLKEENKCMKLSKLKRLLYIYSFYREAFIGFEKKDIFYSKSKFRWYFTKYEKLRQSIYIYNLYKLYENFSEYPQNGEMYIYYPLHQEPEASIQNRTAFNNQLYIIEKISELLPKNWFLYVKEHPSEFYIYEKFPYFYKNINLFRSPDFYIRLKKIDNVKLIKINSSSEELIAKSQAVASICGTSLIEGLIQNKPLLVFGDNLNIIEKIKGVNRITCINDLKISINKIKEHRNNDFYNINEIIELFKNYTFYREKKSPFYVKLIDLCSTESEMYKEKES